MSNGHLPQETAVDRGWDVAVRHSIGGHTMPPIKIKRVYLPCSPDDGLRILVERLWPRGMTKAKAHVDLWLKDIAPSRELRTWFGHDPARWDDFKKRYWRELKENPSALKTLYECMANRPVTLVYAAYDEQHNSALALKEFVEKHD